MIQTFALHIYKFKMSSNYIDSILKNIKLKIFRLPGHLISSTLVLKKHQTNQTTTSITRDNMPQLLIFNISE